MLPLIVLPLPSFWIWIIISFICFVLLNKLFNILFTINIINRKYQFFNRYTNTRENIFRTKQSYWTSFVNGCRKLGIPNIGDFSISVDVKSRFFLWECLTLSSMFLIFYIYIKNKKKRHRVPSFLYITFF